MNITFIVPSWHYFHDPFRLQPYWEMYYATILRKQLGSNYNVKICDLRGVSEKKFSEAVKKIPQSDFLYLLDNEIRRCIRSLFYCKIFKD